MNRKAAAAVFHGAGKPFEIREFDITPTPAGFARLKLIASGVCGTDMHIFRGKLDNLTPAIIGHEFVGVIEDADAAEAEKFGLKVGDKVIVGKYSGTQVKFDGVEYNILRQDEVLAIVE